MAEQDTYLDTLKKAIQTSNVAAKARAAGTWFRQVVQRTKGKFSGETPDTIMSRSTTFSSNVLGKMYFFYYDPKWKNELPWYDRFPLIFPIQRYSDGFLGMNFHYLHPKDRAILMDELKGYANNNEYDETTKLALTYNTLRGFGKLKRARPTIHSYLNTKVQSKFVLINADEWEVALFLPVERFKKANKSIVWKHSGGMF